MKAFLRTIDCNFLNSNATRIPPDPAQLLGRTGKGGAQFMGDRETNIARGKATRLHWSTGEALVKNHARRFLKHDSSQVGVAPPQDPSAMGLRSPLVDQ